MRDNDAGLWFFLCPPSHLTHTGGTDHHFLSLLFMQTITKRDLVTQISNKTNMGQAQVLEVLESFLSTVTSELADGNAVVIRNFGSFQVREMKGKIGRNPKNPGLDMVIPPRAVVKFKPGKELKEKVARILPMLQEV